MLSEFQLIDQIKKIWPKIKSGPVGIGDDAAVLNWDKKQYLLMTTDTIADGIDFHLNQVAPEKIARKALAINLSDIAAKGGEPFAFVVTLGLPKGKISTRWIKQFYQTAHRVAKSFHVECIGGDLSASKTLFISITLLGRIARKNLKLRRAAKKGDWIGVTGTLGGSILGHHFDFQPRLKEGQFLSAQSQVNAMIDISDGLIQDLQHVLRASKTGAALCLDSIPVSAAARKLSKGNRVKALQSALGDGEDFELLFTAKANAKLQISRKWKSKFPKTHLSWIGQICKSSNAEIFWHTHNPKLRKFKILKKGYQHFS